MSTDHKLNLVIADMGGRGEVDADKGALCSDSK